jgi:hypothetical protein
MPGGENTSTSTGKDKKAEKCNAALDRRMSLQIDVN